MSGSERWALTRALQDKVAFDNICLRRIFRIPLYTDHVTNASVRLRAGSPPQLSQLIQIRRLRFFGHVARMDTSLLTSLEHSRCQSEGCPRIGGISWTSSSYLAAHPSDPMQIYSLTTLALTQHGNTPRIGIENIRSTSCVRDALVLRRHLIFAGSSIKIMV